MIIARIRTANAPTPQAGLHSENSGWNGRHVIPRISRTGAGSRASAVSSAPGSRRCIAPPSPLAMRVLLTVSQLPARRFVAFPRGFVQQQTLLQPAAVPPHPSKCGEPDHRRAS